MKVYPFDMMHQWFYNIVGCSPSKNPDSSWIGTIREIADDFMYNSINNKSLSDIEIEWLDKTRVVLEEIYKYHLNLRKYLDEWDLVQSRINAVY